MEESRGYKNRLCRQHYYLWHGDGRDLLFVRFSLRGYLPFIRAPSLPAAFRVIEHPPRLIVLNILSMSSPSRNSASSRGWEGREIISVQIKVATKSCYSIEDWDYSRKWDIVFIEHKLFKYFLLVRIKPLQIINRRYIPLDICTW